jgi:putative salt-induced outer membrane protein
MAVCAEASEGEGPADGEADAGVPWKLRAELSYVNTSGNTDTQTLAGKLDLKKEGPVNRYFANGSYLKAEGSGTDTSDKLVVENRYERVLTERYFGLFTVGYLSDKFSGYDFRAYAGPGAGIEIINKPKQRLQGLLSILYNHDEFSRGTESADDYVTARATGKYEWKALENLTFKETLDYFTSVEETEVYFVDSVTALEVKVNGRISVGMNYTVNYQNRPPSAELRHTDTTLLTTLIIDF